MDTTPDWRARILYDDARLLVVDKPPGWPSTGRTPDDPACVQGAYQALFGRPLWAPHQLDKDTSGVLVLARRKSAARELGERFARRQVRKRYAAIVHGVPERDALTLDGPVDGKAAFTRAFVVERADAFALVEARPRTGRTHQIRVHLADAGHPIVGEGQHKDPPCALHPRVALHAARLELDDERVFEAPLAPDLVDLWAELSRSPPGS
jgi:23S rRNA-/tRNA-specific pseudouridylate synthase